MLRVRPLHRSPVRVRRRAAIVTIVGVVCGLGIGAAPRAARAQSTQEIVAQRELAYRAARDAYDAAVSAYDVLSGQFNSALRAVDRARRSQDEQAIQDAMASAYERGVPLRAQDMRVHEAAKVLEAARDSLIQAITARLQELVARMEVAPVRQRPALDTLFRDLSRRLESLEAEAAQVVSFDPVVLPEINFDPRDGEVDLRAKAELLERIAAVADTVMQDYDRQIRALTNRLRLDQQRRDFLAGARRFGDTQVPVVPVRPTEAQDAEGRPVAAADSTSTNGALTLEQRIENLKRARAQTEAYRNQALIRAAQFRKRIGSIT